MGLMLGIIIGLILGLVNFKILSITVKKSVKMVPRKASFLLFVSYFLRYFFIAVIAIIFIKFLKANIFALVISLLIANILPTLILKKKYV